MSTLGEDALIWCNELAELSEQPGTVDRGYLSPSHRQACDRIAGWMNEAGLEHWRDAAGNLWGRLASSNPEAPVVIMGSHLDTPPNGGRYDGSLGMVMPLLVMKQLKSQGVELPFHLELVGFGDDKGGRFGIPLPGGRAVAGSWDNQWNGRTDHHGHSLADAFAEFGLDIDRVDQAERSGEPILAYLETNLEQGPILESEELPIGIVAALAGVRRFSIEFSGEAGHAGAVPMHLRQDALAAAAEFTLIVERVAREHGVTATVGRLTATPCLEHVIPGRVELSLDIRSEQDTERDAALDMIWETAKLACEARYIDMHWDETYVAPAVACADELQSRLATAIERQQLRPRYLVSGADHDAIAMTRLGPVALLFLRCTGGISHQLDADISPRDVDLAARVLNDWLVNLPTGK